MIASTSCLHSICLTYCSLRSSPQTNSTSPSDLMWGISAKSWSSPSAWKLTPCNNTTSSVRDEQCTLKLSVSKEADTLQQHNIQSEGWAEHPEAVCQQGSRHPATTQHPVWGMSSAPWNCLSARKPTPCNNTMASSLIIIKEKLVKHLPHGSKHWTSITHIIHTEMENVICNLTNS